MIPFVLHCGAPSFSIRFTFPSVVFFPCYQRSCLQLRLLAFLFAKYFIWPFFFWFGWIKLFFPKLFDWYDSFFLIVEQADSFSNQIMHRTESRSYILVFRSGFVLHMMLCMSADTGGAKTDHAGFYRIKKGLPFRQKLVIISLGCKSQ